MELKSIIEALLFSSHGALSVNAMVEAIRSRTSKEPDNEELHEFSKIQAQEVENAIQELIQAYAEEGHSFTLTKRSAGWRICALPEYADWSRTLFPEVKPSRLSPPALETLAIIAYRQPITKANMEAVRGVAVDGVLQKLLDKNLIRIAGRADLPGRPLLYETTDLFLEHFGIQAIEDLPNSSELRQVPLPDNESTAEGAEPAETQMALTALEDASLVSKRNKSDLGDAHQAEAAEELSTPNEDDESETVLDQDKAATSPEKAAPDAAATVEVKVEEEQGIDLDEEE